MSVAPWLTNDFLWRVERTCKQCGKKYNERSNTGAWQCAYHPGKFVRDYHQANNPANYVIGKWTCCGRGASRLYGGCTACDHDDGEYAKDKKTFWNEGIKPMELPDETQVRLWQPQKDFHPVYFRPGMRKKSIEGDNYYLMPYDQEVAMQRVKYGFQRYTKFGLKMGDGDVQVLSMSLMSSGGMPLIDLSTDALYGKPRIKWVTHASLKEGSKYHFVDIASGKEREEELPKVCQHILRHRERSPDPRIAYYTQS